MARYPPPSYSHLPPSFLKQTHWICLSSPPHKPRNLPCHLGQEQLSTNSADGCKNLEFVITMRTVADSNWRNASTCLRVLNSVGQKNVQRRPKTKHTGQFYWIWNLASPPSLHLHPVLPHLPLPLLSLHAFLLWSAPWCFQGRGFTRRVSAPPERRGPGEEL